MSRAYRPGEGYLAEFLMGLGDPASPPGPRADAERGITVAEIGSGDGAFLEAALGCVRGWSCAFGVEPDFQRIIESSERFQDDMRVSFMQASAEKLPLRSGCADLAIVSKALHHFADPRQALAEIRRALKPSGAFALIERVADGLDADQLRWQEYHALRGRIDALRGMPMRELYAESELEALLSGAGFAKAGSRIVTEARLGGEEARLCLGQELEKGVAELPEGPERISLERDSRELTGRLGAEGMRRPPLCLGKWRIKDGN